MCKFIWQYLIVLVLFVCCLMVIGCERLENSKEGKYREAKMLMGTIIHLDICQENLQNQTIELAYKEVWKRLETISWRMNVLDTRSDVSKINNSNQNSVVVGNDTYHVLDRALYFSKLSEGAFDISVWPLIKLWKNAQSINVLPMKNQIKNAKNSVGMNNIKLMDNHRVLLTNAQTKIDLGGIAKGFAIDEAARIFREHGIERFFIDAGGDVYAGGVNCTGKSWRVGIRNPQDISEIMDIVEITDSAVATSGNYEQYYEIAGQKWSHIMNPITGYPQKDVISATVIAPNALDADALATALTVMGAEKATQLINNLTTKHASLIIVDKGLGQLERTQSKSYARFKQ